MEEENKDGEPQFATDSERYTYLITHAEEEPEDTVEYPYHIFQCINCQTFIDETETKPDITMPYDKRLKCPKCGKKKFKFIKSKEEKEKLIKAMAIKQKKEKLQSEKVVDMTLYKIKKEVGQIQSELTGLLKQGKITPKRFAALMHHLIFNEYKYYSRVPYVNLSVSDFDHLAKDISSNILETNDVKEELEDVLEGYLEQRDHDMLYLTYTKQIAEGSTEGSLENFEYVQTQHEIQELDTKIRLTEEQNQRVVDMVERQQEKQNDKLNNSFKKDLRKSNQ